MIKLNIKSKKKERTIYNVWHEQHQKIVFLPKLKKEKNDFILHGGVLEIPIVAGRAGRKKEENCCNKRWIDKAKDLFWHE